MNYEYCRPILKLVPVIQADIHTHFRRTTYDLLHILHGKNKLLLPDPNTSVQGTLIDLEKLLNRDDISTVNLFKPNNNISGKGGFFVTSCI